MKIMRLQPPIWLHTPDGDARAHFLIIHEDDEQDDQWKCCLQKNGEWWTYVNQNVRAHKNRTFGRLNVSKIGRKR